MLTDWDTYRLREGSWQDLVRKIDDIPGADSGLKTDGADFDRGFILDKYYFNISFFKESDKINIFYIGTDKETGRDLLEKVTGFKLESVPQQE